VPYRPSQSNVVTNKLGVDYVFALVAAGGKGVLVWGVKIRGSQHGYAIGASGIGNLCFYMIIIHDVGLV